MMPLDAGWNDLGTWEAVWDSGEKDISGNISKGDVVLYNTRDSLIYSNNRLVGVVGISNIVVIETSDAVLVLNKDQCQDVKKIVSELKFKEREEHLLHRKVNRPWGWFDTLDIGDRFKVKRIQVNPGASLSLQKHNKRAEHWVVVRGVAEVICGDKIKTLYENESTYISPGQKHRLSNAGDIPLEVIEIQSGEYLDEDDIERFEDIYGRKN